MPRIAGLIAIALLMLGGSRAPAADPETVWPLYWQALRHQCPAKQLDLLGPAELRDALEAYKSHADPGLRARLDRGERHQCSGAFGGPGCDNLADLGLIEKRRQLGAVTAEVCGHFALCRGQSDCDAAR